MRSVVITGASSGIGRATALYLDALGYRVFAGFRRDRDGEALRREASERLVPVRIDVTEEISIAAAAEIVRQALGDDALGGLVNNAGVGTGGPVEYLPLQTFRDVMEVNFLGQVAVTQAFLPLLRHLPGRIVNITSAGGRFAGPLLAPYHSSKWALEALSDSLRIELAPWGIHVAVIEPGAVQTAIWGKAVDAAQAVRAGLNDTGRERYGDQIEAFAQMFERRAARGVDPIRVAQAIDHALTAARPKTRYLIGPDARLVATLRWLLPDRVFDAILSRAQ